MPRGEKLGGAVKPEVVGENERETFEQRGEKTLSAAEREQKIKDLLAEKAQLEERNREIEKALKELKEQEAQSHVADPDEYWESVKAYNHDELEKVQAGTEEQKQEEPQSHVADPDEYWESVKAYNHDELEKVQAGNEASQDETPSASDDQAAVLEQARAYNEAHADQMYENWEEGQGIAKNETEEQWTAFYRNRGEELGGNNDRANQAPEPVTGAAPDQAPEPTSEAEPATNNPEAEAPAAAATEAEPVDEPATEEVGDIASEEVSDTIAEKVGDIIAEEVGDAAPEALTDIDIPESIREAVEEGKDAKGFKRLLITIGVAAAALIMAASGFITNLVNKAKANQNNPKQIEYDSGKTIDEEGEEDVQIGETEETEKGIIDGYNKKGMFLSENKGGKYDFAAGSEVAEVCDNDDHEMMKYPSRVQVECLADYIALMPENMQPEGFKGLSILEAEEKLQSLSDEEYDALFKGYGKQVEAAKTKKVELNGRYRNAYMRVIDSSKPVTHDNIELVQCVTEEHGTKATMYYWEDKEGNAIGYIIIKDDCRQGVSEESETDIYKGIEEIPQSILEGEGDMTPTNPGIPTVPTTPIIPDIPDTPKPKDADNLVRIDNKINEEIADDIGTERIENYVNPGVTPEEKTAKPAPVEYQGVQPTIVQNNESKPAEEVTPTTPANNYSENRGGANSGEYQPVQSNLNVQRVADTKTYAPPTTAEEVDAILDDMGIN